MSKLTNILLLVVIVLLLFNLRLTAVVVNDIRKADSIDQSEQQTLAPAFAREWGERVVTLYNRQDYQTLHALFNDQARVKIGEEELEIQLDKLHTYFGSVVDSAFASSRRIGKQGHVEFYQLFFNLRVSQNSSPATMTISLALEDGQYSLYGMKINGPALLD